MSGARPVSEARTPTPGGAREVWQIAYPMILTSASMTLVNFCDAVLLARYHTAAMAASVSGGIAAFIPISLFMGLLGYVAPITAQYLGAGRPRGCGVAVWQGLFLAAPAWLVLLALIPAVRAAFAWFDGSPELVAYQRQYASWYLAVSGPLLINTALGGFFAGIGRTRVVMWANLIGLAVKVPASYALIFGVGAVPALGVPGALLGTLIATATTSAVLSGVLFADEYHERYGTRRPRGDRAAMVSLLRFGGPAAVEGVAAPMALAVFTQLVHGLGDVPSAASTIAFRYDLLAYVPMVGFGVGAGACVGRYMGARDLALARRAGVSALVLALGYGCGVAAVFGLAAWPLVALFRGVGAGGVAFAELSELAVAMLRMVALYALFDGVGTVCAQALRAAGDTRYCLLVSLVAHWLVMLAPVYWFIEVYGRRTAAGSPLDALPHRGALYVWAWLVVFVFVYCAAMLWRFRSGRWQRHQVIAR